MVVLKKIENSHKTSVQLKFLLWLEIGWLFFCGLWGGNEEFAEIRAGSLSRRFCARACLCSLCSQATGESGEKPLEQGKNQQQTQTAYGTGLELNPGHVDRR